MTGYYVRVERDGTWGNFDIAELTDDELDRFIASAKGHDNGWKWVKALAGWIRDHVKESPPQPEELT